MSIEYVDSKIEWIGNIPRNWNIVPNRAVFIKTKEIVGSSSKGTRLLSLTKKGVVEKDIDDKSGKQPESFDTYQIVKSGDLVMCLFDIDVSAVFSGISKFDGMISSAYTILKCRDTILPLFANYWFHYINDGRKYLLYAKNLRYTINMDDFKPLPILLPPLIDQKRIIFELEEKINKIDTLIETHERQIAKLNELKKSLIFEYVTGKK